MPSPGRPGLTWRQGRCLPYGDGVTFWALGEIVKAHAGILETDDPAAAGAKIDDAVAGGPGPRLAPPAAATARRRRCLVAGRARRAVHRLADVPRGASPRPTRRCSCSRTSTGRTTRCSPSSSTSPTGPKGVPLLVVATARPELFERHATFAAGLPNVNRINLAPLSDAETGRARRAGSWARSCRPALQAPDPRAGRGQPPLRRGVRPAAHRPRPARRGRRGGGAQAGRRAAAPGLDRRAHRRPPRHPPAGAQGDARRRRRRGQGVLGRGRGGDGRAGRRRRDRRDARARPQGARPPGPPQLDGRRGRVRLLARPHPRRRLQPAARAPRRAARHVAAAQWLEAKAGERVEDIAEVLAHHYATALDLARAAGQAERAAELEPRPSSTSPSRARRR